MLRAYTQSGPIIAPKGAPCVMIFGHKGLAPAKKEHLADHSLVPTRRFVNLWPGQKSSPWQRLSVDRTRSRRNTTLLTSFGKDNVMAPRRDRSGFSDALAAREIPLRPA
jgi:hypothetical protein